MSLAKLTPNQRLAACRAKAYEYMPYFRSGIQSLVPVMRPGYGTLGVTKNSILIVDPEVLAQWTAEEGAAVALHEYLHIFFKHHDRFIALLKSFAARVEDAEIWNWAADCEINDNLEEAGLKLPKLGGKEPITAKGLKLPNHKTAEEYFIELKKRSEAGQLPGLGQGGQGWGRCGSGAGNELADEPDGESGKNPDGSDAPQGRTEAEQHIQRKADAEQIRKAAEKGMAAGGKRAGYVPGGLVRASDAMLAPPTVSWLDKLQRAARTAVASVQGMGDFTFTYRNRMQSTLELMMGDDAPVLPGEHATMAEVVFIVDTSGSMGERQLLRICSEAQGVLQHMGGAKISFIAIDAIVQSQGRSSSIKEICENLKGGGGTLFMPAFDAIEKMKPKPNLAIFATDGYNADTLPDEPPPGLDVIWLILDGRMPASWGEEIHISTGDVS